MEHTPTWLDKGTKTVFFQGIFSNQTQLAKYTGDRGFTATTGEHVVLPGTLDLIHHAPLESELSDITLRDTTKWPSLWGAPQHLISGLGPWWYGMKITGTKDKTVASHEFNFSKLNIGQEGDMIDHMKRLNYVEQTFPGAPKVLYSVSRGCMATVNAYSTYKYEHANIQLVILEGAPSSVEDVTEGRYGVFGSLVHSAADYFLPSYKANGPQPIDMIEKFPGGVPVAYITSDIDSSVPAKCTRRLAQKHAALGNNPVYLLNLKNSRHPSYMLDDDDDKRKYRWFVHELYKELGLSHIPDYAGDKTILNETRLSAGTIVGSS